ncbi:MAG TPA: histidine kinase N-terminal 7TM domain-containing protein [Candidatus Saccharimonadales bacterium]|nr:histidine kinase N-terminal 7TM domain-containing protein [Candidatus Saccharimonadales bacterium]
MNILSFSPNPIAFSFIGCAIINLFFVGYLLRRKTNNMSIFWFVLFTIVTAVSGLANAFISMSTNQETFSFWTAITGFTNILPAPLLFSFALSFANKTDYLKKIWVILPLYITCFTLIFFSLSTELLFSPNISEAIHVPWGLAPKAGTFNFVIGIYFLLIQIIYFSILLRSYFTDTDQKRKKQIKIMLFAIAIVLFSVTLSKGFLPQIFHWPVFPSEIYLQIILVAATVYVFSKYGLSAFNIDSVSEKLLQLIPSSVVILDNNNIIELANPSAETLFHNPKAQLTGVAIKDFFLNPEEYEKFVSTVLTPLRQNTAQITQLHKGKLLSDTNKTGLSVDIHATIVKNTEDKNGNILVIFTNIQEVLDQASQLEQRLQEIEKQKTELEEINKTMIDRELKMIELKKEIELLKKTPIQH